MACRQGIRNPVPKSTHWRENILPLLDEGRFRHMLRVDRNQFNCLLSIIENDEIFSSAHSSKQLQVETQLAITLYRLGSTGESATFRKTAALFGVGDGGTLDKITNRVFNAFLHKLPEYIQWFTIEERKDLVAETLHELPYCIGYIDGSEVKLAEMPVINHEVYFSRKHIYSVKMQIVCDKNLKIRDVVVGSPGSYHDAKIWKNCNLFRCKENYFSEQEWLAGDSAYPLSDILITPYRRTNFNKRLSKYRVRAEQCFGLLKEMFGSLKELRIRIKDDKSQKFCCKWILVCCMLHNILLNGTETTNFASLHEETSISAENGDCLENNHISNENKRQHVYNLMFNQ